jgi:hypothetical protein
MPKLLNEVKICLMCNEVFTGIKGREEICNDCLFEIEIEMKNEEESYNYPEYFWEGEKGSECF